MSAVTLGLRLRGLRRRTRPRSVWVQPLALIGAAVAVLWFGAALLAPWVAPHDPLGQTTNLFRSPSAAHLMGTDELGRDVFSRVIWGARLSIPVALLLVGLALTIGSTVGGIAGYLGGWVDEGVMRLADLVFAFPTIILAMAVVAALGPGITHAVFAILIVAWPAYARVVRGLVRTAIQSDYVSAVRLLGASSLRALAVDVFPNVAGPVLVLATLDMGTAILLLSGLSFLGLGAQPPTPEWGSMVATGAQHFDRWWIGTFPGLAILTVVMAFNFLGDSLRDALDPRTSWTRAGGEE